MTSTVADLEEFEAVLFDLDGVVTNTAEQHFRAWQVTFDDLLRSRAQELGEPFAPFTRADYNAHVDGAQRLDGVRRFLAARGIELDEDGPEDVATVRSVATRKNDLVNELIRDEGVATFPSTIALLRRLRQRGVKTAVVSASRNCAMVLAAAGVADLFDTRVDGEVAAAEGLPGKPAPDTFLAAAARLGVDPQRAVVIEDALAGVAAGRAGGFGLVIGVDRVGHAAALREHGADLVVPDLADLPS